MLARRRLALASFALAASGCASGSVLPNALAGWRAIEPGRTVDRQGLYQLINGAAEVFLMHGFQGLTLRGYQSPDGALLVEIFDQGSVAGAYAAFTHNRDPEGKEVAVGEGGHLQSGSLWFWRGRRLVCVSGRGEGAAPAGALEALARAVATRLPFEGGPPSLVQRLPADGLRRRTVRYFRAPAALGYHLEELDGWRLGLDGRAEAALGEYHPGPQGSTMLLLIHYPGEHEAQAGLAAASEQLQMLRSQPSRAWRGADRRGRLVAAVLQARSPAAGRALLRAAFQGDGTP